MPNLWETKFPQGPGSTEHRDPDIENEEHVKEKENYVLDFPPFYDTETKQDNRYTSVKISGGTVTLIYILKLRELKFKEFKQAA